jgi:threonine/homoserine/homoserine lactone efflux protein
LFLFTIIPLICTPGPDILLIASQGLANGQKAMLCAVTGVLIGYAAHAIFAIGLAALVAASPLLFSVLKWAGGNISCVSCNTDDFLCYKTNEWCIT